MLSFFSSHREDEILIRKRIQQRELLVSNYNLLSQVIGSGLVKLQSSLLGCTKNRLSSLKNGNNKSKNKNRLVLNTLGHLDRDDDMDDGGRHVCNFTDRTRNKWRDRAHSLTRSLARSLARRISQILFYATFIQAARQPELCRVGSSRSELQSLRKSCCFPTTCID